MKRKQTISFSALYRWLSGHKQSYIKRSAEFENQAVAGIRIAQAEAVEKIQDAVMNAWTRHRNKHQCEPHLFTIIPKLHPADLKCRECGQRLGDVGFDLGFRFVKDE